VLFVVIAGCTNLTEYDEALSAGLNVVSAEDFTTVTTISGIKGARSLLLYPGSVFVVSTEGVIYRYDSETMELVARKRIGAQSSAGYSDAVFSTVKDAAYIIGPYGDVFEIGLPECAVVDQFNVCQSPVSLALGAGSSNLFIADGPSNKIYQVRVSSNNNGDNVNMCSPIRCMAPCMNPDSMLVATVSGISLVSVISPVSLRRQEIIKDDQFVLIGAVPNSSVFVGVQPHCVGILNVFSSVIPPPPYFYGDAEFSGDPFRLAVSNDWQHAYILTYLAENNTSRLVSYSYCLRRIDKVLDIPGYPLDMEVLGGETIYVLTAE